MIHVTQTCRRCGGALHPGPAPRPEERYPLPMVHTDGSEECTARPGHQGLPEHLTGG
ncbi:hypothetical protein [Streptomyces decoyicus]